MSLTVGALTEQIKNLLETTFLHVSVEGELSRITRHNSGHIYFTLKDADATISAVMFRANAAGLKFRLEEGLKVVVSGSITVYKPSGNYQIRALSIAPAGQGALALAYEQLKKELSELGYFDAARKKSLPRYPRRIALITSATGAALQDMLRVASGRWRALHVSVFDVLVQGESAALQIAQAIGRADTMGFDMIVIGRGGGSVEDLWAFNERVVADALFAAQTPTVSAVGHEIDWVISDFVADLRAPTPSAAMQLILPDQHELLQGIDVMMTRLEREVLRQLAKKSEALSYMQESLKRHSIERKIEAHAQSIVQLRVQMNQQMGQKLAHHAQSLSPLREAFDRAVRQKLSIAAQQLSQLCAAVQSSDPKLRVARGFAQVSQEGKVVTLEALHVDEIVDLADEKVTVRARVVEKRALR
ncbi:MAG: exodeoxyribonuclease VII large subunit [Campylobacterales bacterium]|nr:exodeoxyribonuclease VII large subunit [Campylobacterales bacterium]